MDSLDTLMSKVNIRKEKAKKDDSFANNSRANSMATNTSTLASSPDSFEDNSYRFIMSPKSPVFKPQQTPTDMIPEMLLPVSEINSEIGEEQEQEMRELDRLTVDRRGKYSCPVGPTLNIWLGNSIKDSSNFEMIEESEADEFNLDDSPKNKKPIQNKGSEVSPKKMLVDGFTLDNRMDFKRVRSQSENITACTIFKFMEAGNLSQKKRLL